MCFIASEEPKMKHPFDLCDAVEKLPASEQQTIVSLMAYKVVKSLLACEQEIARLTVCLDKAGVERLHEETALADAEKRREGYILAPCPLCGARADLVEDTDFHCHYIGCSNSKCGITLFATKHKTIKEQLDAWNLYGFRKPRNLEKTPVVRALRDRLGRYEEALKKINNEDIDCVRDAVRIAESAIESLPTIRKVDDDPDDYYTEPTDGSHGMQGVPGR